MVQHARCCVAKCPGVLRVGGVRYDGAERRLRLLACAVYKTALFAIMRMGPNPRPRMRSSSAVVCVRRQSSGGDRYPPLTARQLWLWLVGLPVPNRLQIRSQVYTLSSHNFPRIVRSASRTKFGSKTSARKPASVCIQRGINLECLSRYQRLFFSNSLGFAVLGAAQRDHALK